MILIVVKWPIRPERADTFLADIGEFSRATRGEPGNLFFEWSRSVDDPNTFVLVEGFADSDAGALHVGSAHFAKAMDWLPDAVSARPQIIHVNSPDASGWGEMGEVTPR